MALPKQVQASLDAADAFLAAQNAESAGGNELATLAAEPVAPIDPFAQAVPPQQAAPVAPPAPESDVWEQRYKVLQGKYDAEVPRLHHQVRDLETNLRSAVDRMDAVSKARESAPEPRMASDPKDAEMFGADLVDMVSRVAGASLANVASTVDAKVGQLEAQIAKLKQALDGTHQQVAVSAEQSFFDRVTKLVPNWEAVNTDPGFLAWLGEVDAVYGVARQAALQRAQEGLNADRVAAVFNAYLGPKAAAPKGPDPLDKQVSPRSAASVAPTTTTAPTVTQAQVTKFYDDVRRGVYRGNEAEASRIEQFINLALAEGRVR